MNEIQWQGAMVRLSFDQVDRLYGLGEITQEQAVEYARMWNGDRSKFTKCVVGENCLRLEVEND